MYVTVQTNDRTQVYTKEFLNKVGIVELTRLAFEHYNAQEQYDNVPQNYKKKNNLFTGLVVGEMV